MPPKSVTCSVCNNSVLKAQTLARADGTRACRSHEGVADEAEKLAETERKRRDAALERGSITDQWARDRRAESEAYSVKFEAQAAAFREKVYSHCWTCDEYGLEGREFFTQVMVAQKRLQLRGEFDFMTLGQDVRKFMGNVRLLVPFQSKDKTIDRAVIKHVKEKRVRDIAPLLGFVLMCPECARKHGFGKRFDDMMPKPTWEQVEAIMPAVAAIDPILTMMAEKKEGQS